MRTSLHLATLVLATACDQAPPRLIDCDVSRRVVVFDPYQHVTCPSACFDDMDCPRGTLCNRPSAEARGTCEIGTTALQTSRSALLEGFGVPQMTGKLTPEDDTSLLEFTWKRPEGAQYVQCALFACAPAFRTEKAMSDPLENEWLDASPSTAVIANYDLCVLADSLSSEPEGSLNLRDPAIESKPPDALTAVHPSTSSKCNKYGCAPINDLLVGCWAYDQTRIVAATRLESVDFARGMFNYHHVFANSMGDCTDTNEHPVCRLDMAGAGGSGSTSSGDTTTDTGTTSGGSASASGGDTEDTGEPPIANSIYGLCDATACVRACTRDLDCMPKPNDAKGPTVEGWIGYCNNAGSCTAP